MTFHRTFLGKNGVNGEKCTEKVLGSVPPSPLGFDAPEYSKLADHVLQIIANLPI